MNKLKELINELCPDGVEYESIGNCCSIEKGKTAIQKAIPGEYPLVVTTEERKTANSFQFNTEAVCIPLVSSRGHGVASLNHVFYQTGKFALGNILCAVIPNRTDLDTKFLYHYLEYSKDFKLVPLMKGGANVSLHINDIERVRIPIPPLAVQKHIVHILDAFKDLNDTLQAELTDRKQQYEYYRDELLTFDAGTEYVPLQSVVEIDRGTRVTRSQLSEEGKYPVYQNSLTLMGYYQEKNRDANNTFLICAGAAGDIGYCHRDFWAADDCYTFSCSERIVNRYLFHALKSKQNLIYSRVRRASIPRISREALNSIKIPVPPLEVQNRIVSVLDNFDAICSDLNIGLPAEIEARQKQYEFYRDQLLTFAETGNSILTDRQTDRQTDRI